MEGGKGRKGEGRRERRKRKGREEIHVHVKGKKREKRKGGREGGKREKQGEKEKQGDGEKRGGGEEGINANTTKESKKIVQLTIVKFKDPFLNMSNVHVELTGSYNL